MTEDEAKAWLASRFGDAQVANLHCYVEMLLAESERQNLISKATIPVLWARHIVDSAQLLLHAGRHWSHWVDIGSGAGLPGIVIACLSDLRVTLIEPRKLRSAFLTTCAKDLKLRVDVIQAKAEQVTKLDDVADVVSARAVANLSALLTAAKGFSDRKTVFVLPKGEAAQSEVAMARKSWQGQFHVEQSIVDPASGIVIATQVAPR
ncbi:16S rRNA (guanine(527)-N(7))-methyltransferase RsmG [Sphingomonas floccifaciens]|uniref:Ribosomal RNA small subunit methyltransferase G n=1 Tax=Sphingomonas floccifaciens TaxID=1844115 RepID=A0ABW4NB86_9SPHN